MSAVSVTIVPATVHQAQSTHLATRVIVEIAIRVAKWVAIKWTVVATSGYAALFTGVHCIFQAYGGQEGS